MARLYHRVTKPAAEAPGTVSFTGERKVDEVTIKVIDYDDDAYEEREVGGFEDCLRYRDTDTCTWINVNGLHDTSVLMRFGEHFGLHPLVLEDIVNTHQRPKAEDYGDYLYIVCRMLSLDETGTRLEAEQISLVIGRNFLLTFQERPGDVLEPVRERLRKGGNRIRRSPAGYLGYALLDSVVDHYFHVMEIFGEQIEALEEELLAEPGLDARQRIHTLKREMVLLGRAVRPLRDLLSDLVRDEPALMGEEIAPFLRDVEGHTVQVADMVESFRDVISGLQDLYLSSVSNRMNEVMKVLTIFASIFVPLTFVAGIYGMNFEHMPELGWRWSYPIFWGAIIVLVVVMLTYFRRKKWL